MSYLKKSLLVSLIVVLAVLLASCGFGQIEDTNGDSPELCELTDDDIFNDNPKSVQFGSVYSSIGGKYSLKVNKFSGVESVAKFSANGTKLVINSDSTLQSGNFRIVLMHDGEYLSDIPTGEKSVTIDSPEGDYEIRVAGESAKFDIVISYSVDN